MPGRPSADLQLAQAIEKFHIRQRQPAGYLPWELTQCSLPYRSPDARNRVWRRRNGAAEITVITRATGEQDIGLPFGGLAVLLLAFFCGEAFRSGEPTIELDGSYSAFMKKLGLASTGGMNGSRKRLAEQLRRLTNSSIRIGDDWSVPEEPIFSDWSLWGQSRSQPQPAGRRNFVEFSDSFFRHLTHGDPVAVDLDALSLLKFGGLAANLYVFLTAQLERVKEVEHYNWEYLAARFNGIPDPNYASSKSRIKYEVKRDIRKTLPLILTLLRSQRIALHDSGIHLDIRPMQAFSQSAKGVKAHLKKEPTPSAETPHKQKKDKAPRRNTSRISHFFISYPREEKTYASQLAELLTKADLNAWYDHDIDVGERWVEVVREKIVGCVALIVIMTPDAERSRWVQREVRLAECEGKPILPLLRSGEVWFSLNDCHYGDVRDGELPGAEFVDQLKALCQPKQTAPARNARRLQAES
ncbi:TIR domain-containing protein [Actinoplanes sp. LDG1-01]|uniref:TIR domain-containing protein n=1 Tax=Paractinoplanes lichenicola TaxID=2802976 RepID=A0ABS1VQC1_9ACTN|nr:TIR domain-containing protein [Actinoplanes lichenicola]